MKYCFQILFILIIGVVVMLWCCQDKNGYMSMDKLIKELERQHLPTPIFANHMQLEYILSQYGKK